MILSSHHHHCNPYPRFHLYLFWNTGFAAHRKLPLSSCCSSSLGFSLHVLSFPTNIPSCILCFIHGFLSLLHECIFFPIWNAVLPIPLNSSNSPFSYQLRCRSHREVFLRCFPDWTCFCSEKYVYLITLSPNSIYRFTIRYIGIICVCLLRDDMK